MSKYQIEVNNREILAKNPNTKIEILEKLAFDAELKVKKAVALRSDLSIDLIKKMAMDRQIIAKKFLLRNKSFSENLLLTLSQSSEPKVIQMVALHPNTPISLLNKLATIPSAKSFVAQNSNITVNLLEQLSKSDDNKILLAVVKNRKTTPKILIKIAYKNDDYKILIPIVENNNTLDRVKSNILERLSIISKLEVRQYVANHPCTPQNILLKWAKYYKFYKLHSSIAQNINTPVIALDIIAKNFCSSKVLYGLVNNKNTSRETLEFLYEKYIEDYFYHGVLIGMINHPNTPNYIRESIKTYSFHIDFLAKNSNDYNDILIWKLKYDRRSYDDYFLLKHYDLSIPVSEYLLERLSTSYRVFERKFVALDPKTPKNVLEKLTCDRDMSVRDAAKSTLEKRNL